MEIVYETVVIQKELKYIIRVRKNSTRPHRVVELVKISSNPYKNNQTIYISLVIPFKFWILDNFQYVFTKLPKIMQICE
jgi:hypothetical protein